MRIPMKADTYSNSNRTPFRSCRTVVGAKRRSEGVIKGCPTGVKLLSCFCSPSEPLGGATIGSFMKTCHRAVYSGGR
jgi:hypothetical protein